MDSYAATRDRVEHYFDHSATKVWERLTSDAPVSGIRATVRAGRDRMRETLLAQLPADLAGQRVLDAGCGTGAMAVELAARGAEVVAIDISPALIEIAKARAPRRADIDWRAGDMTESRLGRFDHVVAMDSMIYYSDPDLARVLAGLAPRVRGRLVFTLAPRTPMLMLMWRMGRLFPASDRSPTMVPHSPAKVAQALRDAGLRAPLAELARIKSGFYISQAFTLGGSAA